MKHFRQMFVGLDFVIMQNPKSRSRFEITEGTGLVFEPIPAYSIMFLIVGCGYVEALDTYTLLNCPTLYTYNT